MNPKIDLDLRVDPKVDKNIKIPDVKVPEIRPNVPEVKHIESPTLELKDQILV